jgi:hypothetical protein
MEFSRGAKFALQIQLNFRKSRDNASVENPSRILYSMLAIHMKKGGCAVFKLNAGYTFSCKEAIVGLGSARAPTEPPRR